MKEGDNVILPDGTLGIIWMMKTTRAIVQYIKDGKEYYYTYSLEELKKTFR